MFFFGLDWSQNHHNLCILNQAGARVSQIKLKHTTEGFEQIELERHKLGIPASECLVAIETAHNLVVDFLLDCGYVVYIIPPQATEGYRNRTRSSGAHTDDSDAALLAGILITDRDSHRRWRPNSALTQQMAAQVRLVETLRRTIHRQCSQLRATLSRVHPLALNLFGELTSQITLHFLIAYPTAQEAQTLTREAFIAFCQEHGYKRTDLLPRRCAQLTEPALTADPAVAQAYRNQIQVLAQLLLSQVRAHNQAIVQLGRLFQKHPDAFIFHSLPGAGDVLAPSLLVKFGDLRDRFPRPADVQALAGTCPVTKQSGKRRFVSFRRGCDKEFRRIAQQFARASVRESGWASAYWHETRPSCRSNSLAYRKLANRWLAVIWKMWQTRQPYDEAYHLNQRARRRRPKKSTMSVPFMCC